MEKNQKNEDPKIQILSLEEQINEKIKKLREVTHEALVSKGIEDFVYPVYHLDSFDAEFHMHFVDNETKEKYDIDNVF